MRRSYLAIISGSILLVIFALSWCARKSKPVFTGVPIPPENMSPVTAVASNAPPSPGQAQASSTPAGTSGLQKVAPSVSPAVILISVFDNPGKLLRTGTGFFISEDGKFVTSRHFVEGGAHGVVKTSDGGIYNVSGALTEGATLDVSVLQAEVKKKVPFLTSGKTAGVNPGTRVAVIGSPLARGARAFFEASVAAQKSDQKSEWLELSPAPPNELIGAPAVNENGELLGVVTAPTGQGNAANIVRSAGAVDLLVAKVDANAKARWQAGQSSPSPTPAEGSSPSPRSMATMGTETTGRTQKPRIIYNPKPPYPSYSYFREKGSGNFRITFSATGQAANVETIRSTGNQTLDNVTLEALRRWKSTPGQQWSVTVPVTFERR
jgi:TonB family protein